MKRSLASLNLRFGQDVVLARQRARDISELLGFDHSEQMRERGARTAPGESRAERSERRHGCNQYFVVRLARPGTRAMGGGFNIC